MAKKQKKHQGISKDERKPLDIPIISIADNIVFGKKEVWAYYKVSTVPFDFLSPEAKAGLANNTITALASLSSNNGKKIDGHILITNTPFDIESWVNQIDTEFIKWKNSYNKVYDKFINEQVRELYNGGYQKPIVYLGVKLFNRGSFDMEQVNVFEFGFRDAYEAVKKGINNMFQLPTEEISSFEEKKARDSEEEIFRILAQGKLRARRVLAQELLLTLKRQFYPAMPVPYLTVDHGNRIGMSDIAIETDGYVENKHRYLKFEQMVGNDIYEGYRATLSFARFPKEMSMPGNQTPFMYMPASRGLPYTMSARFTMIPHEDVKKDLNKKKLETDDEIDNLAGSGQDVNAGLRSTVGDLSTLEANLEDSKLPWLNGAYRVTIEMPTFESLKDAIAELKQEYAEQDTTVILTSGDQMDLFLEEMPGSNIRMSSFNQRTSLSMLGVSGFNIGGVAGDPINEQLILTERRKRG